MQQLLSLDLEDARVIIEGCKAKAQEIGVPMVIAVVDPGGHLLAFERMDGSKLVGIQIAIDKAFTAACSKGPTHVYAERAAAGGPAFGIHTTHGGRFVILKGGVPVEVDGQVVGAVGCSSGTGDQDLEVAQAGVDAFHRRRR